MTRLGTIEKKICRRERLTRSDGLAMLRESDLLALASLARNSTEERTGMRVYFNVNCHLNLTNVCISRCSFCAFSCDRSDDRAYVMSPDDVLRKVADAATSGITEVHIVSGLHPDLPFSYYETILQTIKRHFPSVHIKAFTPVEIHYFSQISGRPVRTVLESLRAAGLGSLPGGGAEVLSRRVRKALCPNKATASQWLSIMKTAHRLGLKSNATLLYGHIETPDEIIDHLLQLRSLQDATGGFQAFVPLPFHPQNTLLPEYRKPGAVEQLKMYSISRLMLDSIPNIKAYWVMTGLKTAQLALFFGANDIDGTVTEEKITHAAGAQTARGLIKDELISLINQAGMIPVERDSLYTTLHVHSKNTQQRCPPDVTDHGTKNRPHTIS